MLLDHFEQRPHPWLRRESQTGRQLDSKISLPPEVAPGIAEYDERFSLWSIFSEEPPHSIAFGLETLLVRAIRVLGFAALAKQAVYFGFEPAIQVCGMRLVYIDIQTEHTRVGSGLIMLQLTKVVVWDHSFLLLPGLNLAAHLPVRINDSHPFNSHSAGSVHCPGRFLPE